MQGKELEKHIQWLHNKLDIIYGNQIKYHRGIDPLNLEQLRWGFHKATEPQPEPHRDLQWPNTDKYEELKEEFEESIEEAS